MLRRATALSTTAAALAAALLVGGAVPASAATGVGDVLVTEIAPDTVGADDFEYVEVVNTTTRDIPVGADGVSLAYTYVDGDDRARDVPLSAPAGTVLPAGEPLVFWLTYTSGAVDSSRYGVDDFRAFWAGEGSVPDAYPVVPITGQAGMANGGGRGIRVVDADGSAVSWSFYPTGSVSAGTVAQFARPADAGQRSATLFASKAAPTPGRVDPAQLGATPGPTPTPDPTPTPTPDPTSTPTPTPTPDPTPAPDPAPAPQPDPSLRAASLQITELLPDSANVGGADGYEFVELYNGTDRAIDFADYSLRYLYPVDETTNSSTTLWPSTPREATIAPGGTLVLWIKNAQNTSLTRTDFNGHFGSSLAEGQLLDVVSAGMANSSPRGMEVVTNTGVGLNRAYYNMIAGQDDTQADQGIQYGHDPADQSKQRLLRSAPASPGAVTADQVPTGLVVTPADTTAPVVVDRTAASVDDPTADFDVSFTVTDEQLVRSVRLTVENDIDAAPTTVDLVGGYADPADTAGPRDTYTWSVPGVDLYGKSWLRYSLTATDGTNAVTTDPRTVTIPGRDDAPVRLNVTDGQGLRGTVPVAAAGTTTPPDLRLDIDGETVTGATRALEREPYFAFEAGGVNTYFRNGVLIGRDILTIFDDGIFEGVETITTKVPLSYVTAGEPLTLSVWAGTKAAPEISPENNDDFTIQNLRLVLPDGRTLRPAGYDDPARVLQMGDSTGRLDFYDAVFTLPDDAFGAVSYDWDTTMVADGEHVVTATASATSEGGAASVTRRVLVDNTAPVVATDVESGREYRGEFLLTGSASDAGSGVASFVTMLDGEAIHLPFRASSVDLAGGEHVLSLTATDAVGNVGRTDVPFTTPVEQPSGQAVLPADGAEVTEGEVELRARVDDPSGDRLRVDFARGYELDAANGGVTSRVGTTDVSTQVDGTAPTARALSTSEVEALGGVDGLDTEISSDTALPYQVFDVQVPAEAGADHVTKLTWTGSANTGAKVLMYVKNVATGLWEEVDRVVTTDPADVQFALTASVPAADHVSAAGAMTVLVQHSEGFAGAPRSTRDTAVTPNNPADTPRSAYDFTLAWESDTQYYNADPNNYKHQVAIHDYLLEQRDDLNLQYLTHTGDIVDDGTVPEQWQRADAQYDRLDAAGLPYGVLAGNHDVDQKNDDYTYYSQWFGEKRYASNPWYGGSHLDNRGHYDLVSTGGVDFLMLYMGWAPGDEQIAWMNEVLAQYPERKAIINLHEYMLTTGGLGPVPQRIYDEVVATNPNVMMVMSGHYHDAFTRYDQFDDDGDGTPDRTVTQMLFDYQGLAEGGLGYLRLMHFDNAGQQITVRTYSPSLDRYDSDDPSLELEHQEFVIPYATAGITPQAKTLRTDSFTAEVQTTTAIGSVADVASGTEASVAWPDAPLGRLGWYVTVTDPYGAQFRSGVSTLTVVAAADPGTPGGPGTPGDPDDPGQGGAVPGGPAAPGGPGAGTQPGGTSPAGTGPTPAAQGDRADDRLAYTGADPRLLGLGGLGLLLLAAGAVLVIRRRRARGTGRQGRSLVG
ncbi:lamin tail domain-containing protein [Frigoribacterium sp. 2-23]|uniref:lamin tail domain-containing protein n=1 Tax=Frigoribacterium sp. 2-23 TaxID=3415006 RepID=UPI003C6F7DFD